jgi:hypothetical protein
MASPAVRADLNTRRGVSTRGVKIVMPLEPLGGSLLACVFSRIARGRPPPCARSEDCGPWTSLLRRARGSRAAGVVWARRWISVSQSPACLHRIPFPVAEISLFPNAGNSRVTTPRRASGRGISPAEERGFEGFPCTLPTEKGSLFRDELAPDSPDRRGLLRKRCAARRASNRHALGESRQTCLP